LFLRKHLKFIALFLLAALILWWFGRKLNWAEVRASLQQANWWLLALATAIVIFTYLLRAYRWRAMLAPITPTSLRELYLSTCVGFGAIMIFGRAGEAVRPVVLPLRDPRVRPAAAFITIALERFCDLIATIICFALCLFWLNSPPGHEADFRRLNQAGAFLLASSVAGLVVLALFQKRSQPVIDWLEKHVPSWPVPDVLKRIIISAFKYLAQSLSVFVNWRELAAVSGWTAILWFAVVVYDWLVLQAFGLPFGIAEATFIMSWSLVGSMVPTPGGAAGAFHAAAAAGILFLGRGVTTETAAAAALMIHLTGFGPALPIALYYMLRGDINLQRLRQKVGEEEPGAGAELPELEAVHATK
jgi:hypothetical protein